jgi:hypothetical protein
LGFFTNATERAPLVRAGAFSRAIAMMFGSIEIDAT